MSNRREIRTNVSCDGRFSWFNEPIDNVIEYIEDLKNQGATHVTIYNDDNDVYIDTVNVRTESDEEYNARLVKEESLRLDEIERRQKEELAFYEILKAKFEKQ